MIGEHTKRIIYGVHGYGRGHAVRAMALLPELTKHYDVRVFAGDDAYDYLSPHFDVTRVPLLKYYHGANKRFSPWRTGVNNIPLITDILIHGRNARRVENHIEHFDPDVIISDSEVMSLQVGRRLGIPRISFDHYGVMAFCKLEMNLLDRLTCRAESLLYKAWIGNPERVVATAFYGGELRRDDVTLVGPILRAEVLNTQPADGDYLLLYFSNAHLNFTHRVEVALRDCPIPVKVYGVKDRAGTTNGDIEYCPIHPQQFLTDLAGARAVFATAGNQMISEALYFGKPLLLLPEDSLEQRLNGHYIQTWGAGRSVRPIQVNRSLIRNFIHQSDQFAQGAKTHRRNGLPEAIDAIRNAIEELTDARDAM
jgi:uncharacterized protein (TIGR00661 family)